MTSLEKVINLELQPGVFYGYCDIYQCLAKLNRQGFHQGSEIAIESIRINNYTPGTEVMVHRLPQNWCSTNAHVLGMAEWNEQQIDAAKEAGVQSMKARWRDFKVYMTIEHANDDNTGAITHGNGESNLLPVGYSLANVSPGVIVYQWAYSQFVLPNAGGPGVSEERYGHMLGTDNDPLSVGLIKAYGDRRARPQTSDPNIVLGDYGGFYKDIEDVGEDLDDIISNWSRDGVHPPYPLAENQTNENYPGGEWVGENIKGHEEATAVTGSDMRSVIPGFIAPCGLLRIQRTTADDIMNIQIRIAAGIENQPIAEQPMKEAN